MTTTYRYVVTIHDAGNITNEARNVHTILTSTDNIQPRDRVAVDPADDLMTAAVEVVRYWRRLNTEGPNGPEDLEVALDNATVALEDALTEAGAL